ncbi:DeoR/GlpR family DNA-binding transcription regulator [Xylocopilactobacillus apis]|uniref:DeoR family transcriptional regulator n=1 Tax=Xylocopilactobacillus apis TaxID=2932183 RepID=A0AAU9CY70_9LACO|nr:DeoR/GlpR family DNA-binding transcription regulator [Xylocopilactobacillus apis]BDR57381.1 DeoR family transcriptional regulator [Xylocopilactobacillus apis]
MQQIQRLELMMEKLKDHHSLTLKEIMELTGASRDTARRDIVKLAENDQVERNYGGISLPHTFKRLDDFLTREKESAPLKRRLGKKAASLLKNADQIYLDISTTIEAIPEYLKLKPETTVVTNSIDIADQLLRKTKAQVRLLGGYYLRDRRATTDSAALKDMFGFNFNMSFISAPGITADGVYYAYPEDITFKQQIRRQSEKIALVIDHSRIGLKHNYIGLKLDQIDYCITDESLPADLSTELKEQNVEIIEGD